MASSAYALAASLRFANPDVLALALAIPLLVATSLRSLAALGALRRALALAARCGVAVLFVLALAGLERVRVTDDQTTVFLLDASASVPRTRRDEALAFARAAAERVRPGKDRVALVAFDGAPLVEQLPQPGLTVEGVGSGAAPHRTNLAAALRMALALFPPDAARRVVALSDGNENVGDALAEADVLEAVGVPVDVLPIRYTHAREMLIERVTAPATARRDETIDLGVVVRSQSPATARLLVYQNDALLDLDPAPEQAGFPVALEPGYNRFTLSVPLRESGAQSFRAVLQPERAEDDAVAANNEGRALTLVGAAERVLVVSEDGSAPAAADAELLAAALRRAGIESEAASLGSVALDPAYLSGCSLVVLSNVSALALGESRQRALASFVRELGGGLIVVGGDRAFSLGGYHKTPLEDVLPVETERSKLKLLSLAIVIVIDRSGSMAGDKLELAKSAATAAVQLLGPQDHVGVLAFDGEPEWIVPLMPCDRKPEIVRRVGTIGAGGGTVMHPALEQAYAALVPAGVNLKHVVLLTDGQSTPGDFDGLARACSVAGITVSTIAVGPDADRELLARIAQLSGGRTYATDSARPLPQIFVRETVLASRSGLFEREFKPLVQSIPGDQLLRGIAPEEIPPLDGHVVTAAKPLALVPLVRVHEDGLDPIAAYWQVGLGRAVAFTGGMWSRWGTRWTPWPGFGKFWAQCVRYAARAAQSAEFEIVTRTEGERARMTLAAHEGTGAATASVAMAGRVVGPDFVEQPLEVVQTGPGRFETTFAAPDPGTYIASFSYAYGHGPQATTGALRAGVVVTYSPEYAAVADDATRLAELARRSGGRVLDAARPEAVFDAASVRPIEARLPIWEDLVRLALALFLFDVAVRRLAIDPRAVLRRMRAFVRSLAGRPAPAGAAATVATLRGVRERLREARPGSATPPVAESPAARAPTASDADVARVLGGDASRPAVAPPRKDGAVPLDGEAEYTARLLRAKRAAQREAAEGDERGR